MVRPSHFRHGAAQQVERGGRGRIKLRRLRRISRTDLRAGEPGQRLVGELRMLLQRIERGVGLRPFFELNIARTNAELSLRKQRRFRIFLREGREHRRSLRLLSFVECKHRAVKFRARNVFWRRLIHQRLQRVGPQADRSGEEVRAELEDERGERGRDRQPCHAGGCAHPGQAARARAACTIASAQR